MEKRYFTIEGSAAREALDEMVRLPVYGNVLPVPDTEQPAPETISPIPVPEKQPGRAVRRNRRNIAYLTPAYMFFLCIMAALVFAAFSSLITVSGEITKAERRLAALSATLNTVRSDNSASRVYIDKAVDIKEVYRIAVGEYGMLYPDDTQFIYYTRPEGSFVVQNEEIPAD